MFHLQTWQWLCIGSIAVHAVVLGIVVPAVDRLTSTPEQPEEGQP